MSATLVLLACFAVIIIAGTLLAAIHDALEAHLSGPARPCGSGARRSPPRGVRASLRHT